MSKVVLDMSISLDGMGAGPNPSEEHRMGVGGDRLHEWMPYFEADQADTAEVPEGSEVDARMVQALFARRQGAVVLGKRTFDLGLEPWGGTPFPAPCFVLTHESRDDLVTANGTFTFVTDWHRAGGAPRPGRGRRQGRARDGRTGDGPGSLAGRARR